MKPSDIIPVLLLVLFTLAVGLGAAMAVFVSAWLRRNRQMREPLTREDLSSYSFVRVAALHRPVSWIAIRSRNLTAVQEALGLNNAKPCSWFEGLAGEQKLFIAPPINGWILVVGSDLPEPADDVDACFRFLNDLSRKVGHVQLFNASRALGHHAWVQMEAGRVVRAYAWAAKTLWNQGIKTAAELELGFKCFGYLENFDRSPYGHNDLITFNVERVPLLASRWSLDPAGIDERLFEDARGVAGEASQLY